MAFAHSSQAFQSALISRLIEPANPAFDLPTTPSESQGRNGVQYRSSPDGSVTMGKDLLTKQVALIVQNADGLWDIALPAHVERFGNGNQQPTLEAAKKMVDAAFKAYREQAAAA